MSAKTLSTGSKRPILAVVLALLFPLFGSACMSKAEHVMIDLGPLSEKEAATPLTTSMGEPLQIGIGREIPADQQTIRLDSLSWQSSGKVQSAAVKVRSSGATGLRLGLRLTNPSGCQNLNLSFQGEGDTEFTAIAVTRLSAATVWWSPVLTGDKGRIQLQLPISEKPGDCTILLTRISHIF